jgi:hypothetical protein
MQGNRKKIGLFLIILGLIIIVLIVYFFFINSVFKVPEVKQETEQTNGINESAENVAPETNPGNAPVNYQLYDAEQEEEWVINGDDLGKLAMSITERFGSFSNQSNYGNFTDLKILMTDDMENWTNSYIETLRGQLEKQDNSYYGITTKAINYEIMNFDDQAGEAEIVVSTQRRESTDVINGGEAFNQDLRLVFLKVNGNWLFDAAYWSKD